jgi:hypothetical protein
VLDDLATLLDQERAGLPSANEAQTEERFIKPILERLGFAFTVQAGVGTAGARRQPDYALFVDDADRAAAARQSGRRALPPRRRGLREDQPLRFLGNLRAGTNCWRTCRLRVTLCQKRRSHFANDGYAPSTAETVSKTSPVCAA